MSNKTRDGSSFAEANQFYFVDGGKVTEFLKSELIYFSKFNTVACKDGSEIDLFNPVVKISELFATEDAANLEALEYWKAEYKARFAQANEAQSQINKFEQLTAKYLKPSSDTKTERVGGIVIKR